MDSPHHLGLALSHWRYLIGHFILKFSEVEELMHHLKAGLDGNFKDPSRNQKAITSNWLNFDFNARLNKLRIRIKQNGPPNIYLPLLEQIAELAEDRDVLAHGTFALTGNASNGAPAHVMFLSRQKRTTDEDSHVGLISEFRITDIMLAICKLIQDLKEQLHKDFGEFIPALTPVDLPKNRDQYLAMANHIGIAVTRAGEIEQMITRICQTQWETTTARSVRKLEGEWETLTLQDKVERLIAKLKARNFGPKFLELLEAVRALTEDRNLMCHGHLYCVQSQHEGCYLGIARHRRLQCDFLSEKDIAEVARKATALSDDLSLNMAVYGV